MRAYKVTLFIVDLDEVGKDEICSVLENTRYPNRCISPKVLRVDGRDIGEWSDDHPLNYQTTMLAEIDRLFQEPEPSRYRSLNPEQATGLSFGDQTEVLQVKQEYQGLVATVSMTALDTGTRSLRRS